MGDFLGEYLSEIALILGGIGGGIIFIRLAIKAEIAELTRSMNALQRKEKERELKQKFGGSLDD